MKITCRTRKDGTMSVRIGKETTTLSTPGQADAFIAGARIAREIVLREIGDSVKILISDDRATLTKGARDAG